jgi:hypothetical protein
MAELIKGGGSILAFRLSAAGVNSVSGGTESVDTTTKYELPFTTESFNPTGEFINSNAIAGGRSRGIGCIGNRAGDGSFDTEVTIGNFLWLMYGALGEVIEHEEIGALGAEINVPGKIIPSDGDLPEFSIYIQHGSSSDMSYQFDNCVINSLRMAFSSNALLSASIDWSGKNLNTDQTGEDFTALNFVTYSASQVPICPIRIGTAITHYNDVIWTGLGGLSTSFNFMPYITGIEFTISNNLDTDTNALNASGRLAILSGEFSVTGSLTLLMPDSSTSDLDIDALYAFLRDMDVGTYFGDIEIKIFKTMDTTDPEQGDTDYEHYVLTLGNLYTTQPVHDIADRGKVAYRIDFQATADPSGSLSGRTVYPIHLEYVNTEAAADYVLMDSSTGTAMVEYTF